MSTVSYAQLEASLQNAQNVADACLQEETVPSHLGYYPSHGHVSWIESHHYCCGPRWTPAPSSNSREGYGFAAVVGGIASLVALYFVGEGMDRYFHAKANLERVQEQMVGTDLSAGTPLSVAMQRMFDREIRVVTNIYSYAKETLAARVSFLASSALLFAGGLAMSSSCVTVGLVGAAVSGGILLYRNGYHSHDRLLKEQARELSQAVSEVKLLLV